MHKTKCNVKMMDKQNLPILKCFLLVCKKWAKSKVYGVVLRDWLEKEMLYYRVDCDLDIYKIY